ncbi:MAG: HD domain-containing protein [Treponema sp.]|jgi:HD-GYP domain-containing protein (c-di-GMP phosphodiesterase class II)|nr:HD domain-containing protein [Treponema sp.]
MNDYQVSDIIEGSFFSEPLYLDEGFILATPEMSFSKELAAALLAWNFKVVQSAGEPRQMEFVISDKDKLKQALDFYIALEKYVITLFTPGIQKDDLTFNAVAEKIQAACGIIQTDSRTFFRVPLIYKPSVRVNVQVSHTITSTVIALTIGCFLGLPNDQLIELGVAALLHEIGMTKLPPKINITKRDLTLEDRKAIFIHPMLSQSMLQSLGFPPKVCTAVLQHHERENGTGYPRKLTGDQIHLYAKIIAIACSFEAMTSHRTYKSAKDMHNSLLCFLKNEGPYDNTIVRALINSLTLYPIGLFVLLANGQKGQVVDVDLKNPRFPRVQLIGIPRMEGKILIQTSAERGSSIVRPLTRQEIKDIFHKV